ncbi:MAG: hypothetical protein ABIT76_14995 [Chthoniobacterales bacterium]
MRHRHYIIVAWTFFLFSPFEETPKAPLSDLKNEDGHSKTSPGSCKTLLGPSQNPSGSSKKTPSRSDFTLTRLKISPSRLHNPPSHSKQTSGLDKKRQSHPKKSVGSKI